MERMKADLIKGLDIAFREDSTILIEPFIKGKEYRFMVIGDETVAVLHRVPANVTADGIYYDSTTNQQ